MRLPIRNILFAKKAFIVPNGLVLNLDAGNPLSYSGSGTTWTDLSGLGNHGTLTSGVGYSSSNQGQLLFDGSNKCATNLLATPNNSTQLLWYKWNGVNAAKVLSYLGNAGLNGLGFYQSNNNLTVLYGGITTNAAPPAIPLVADAWYQLAITRDALTTSIYVNNSFNSSTTNAPSASATAINFVPFDNGIGSLGVSLFYNRAISAAEVSQLFDSYRSRYGV